MTRSYFFEEGRDSFIIKTINRLEAITDLSTLDRCSFSRDRESLECVLVDEHFEGDLAKVSGLVLRWFTRGLRNTPVDSGACKLSNHSNNRLEKSFIPDKGSKNVVRHGEVPNPIRQKSSDLCILKGTPRGRHGR